MRRDLIRDQKSIWFFDEGNRGANSVSRIDSIYVDMIPRTIPLHLMPIGGNSTARKDFRIVLVPANNDLVRIIATALSEHGSSYSTSNIERAVCNFVHRVGTRLTHYGKAAFEIVPLRDRVTNDLVACDLFEINVRTLRFEGDVAHQQVPEEIAKERGVPTAISLDPAQLAVFSLPPKLEAALSDTKEALAQAGISKLSAMYDASRADSTLGYDIKEHIRAEHLAVAAASRLIGWDANQSLYEIFTEYYVLHRRLVFERFVILLRQSILSTLNTIVARIGALFDTAAQLEVYGLPTLEDVTRAERELAAGARSFNSVIDDFSLL